MKRSKFFFFFLTCTAFQLMLSTQVTRTSPAKESHWNSFHKVVAGQTLNCTWPFAKWVEYQTERDSYGWPAHSRLVSSCYWRFKLPNELVTGNSLATQRKISVPFFVAKLVLQCFLIYGEAIAQCFMASSVVDISFLFWIFFQCNRQFDTAFFFNHMPAHDTLLYPESELKTPFQTTQETCGPVK